MDAVNDGAGTDDAQGGGSGNAQPDGGELQRLRDEVASLKQDRDAQFVRFLSGSTQQQPQQAAQPQRQQINIDDSEAPSPDDPAKFARWVAGQVAANVVPAVDQRIAAATRNNGPSEVELITRLRDSAGVTDMDLETAEGVIRGVARGLQSEGFDPARLLTGSPQERAFFNSRASDALRKHQETKKPAKQVGGDTGVKTVGTGGGNAQPGGQKTQGSTEDKGKGKKTSFVDAIRARQTEHRVY